MRAHKFIGGVQQYDAYGKCNLCAEYKYNARHTHIHNAISTYFKLMLNAIAQKINEFDVREKKSHTHERWRESE